VPAGASATATCGCVVGDARVAGAAAVATVVVGGMVTLGAIGRTSNVSGASAGANDSTGTVVVGGAVANATLATPGRRRS
jgi:hypothetical protein